MSKTPLVPLLCAAALSIYPAGPASAPQDQASKVDAIFQEYAKDSSPGCAVGVYQDDKIVLGRAYGMANLDHDVRLTPASVFHVASLSKQFTAAAILLLAQDGKLSLDDEARKHVPELPDFGPMITIRHLVHHTSGLRDQWDLLTFAGWRYSRDLITDQDVLSLLSRQADLNFPPGDRHLYSNSGYTLLAAIVSRASGKTFRQFTTERIFAPLGMTKTHFRDSFTEIVKNQAYGYAPAGPGNFRLSVTNFDTAGATSLLTTVEDLAKWHANFDRKTVGGDRLISGMLERGVLNKGEKLDYAFGISHGTYRGLTTIGHGGSDAGYRSMFLRFPDQRFGVATLCNLATANPVLLSQRVADIYLAGALKPVASPASPDDRPEVPLPAEQLSRLAGLYWSLADVGAVRFTVDGGQLQVRDGTGAQRLKSLGSGRFIRVSGPGPQYAFDLTSTGQRSVTIGPPTGGGIVLRRAEVWTPTPSELRALVGTYRSDEIEALYRLTLKDATLRLERLKWAPVTLEPMVPDILQAPFGFIRITRNASGAVSGFVIEAGRVRGLKFSKDTTSNPRKP
jgi:CubicO group peptidase (beta-lactamase class C family)